MESSTRIWVRMKDMNKGVWEYIKIVSKAQEKTISALLSEMAELHAKETDRTTLLKTLIDEYGNEPKELKEDIRKK